MKVLIAPDSFKESLPALEVCHAIRSGFAQIFAQADYTLLPMADGGEGTSQVLSYALGGSWQKAQVHDPLMRPITAQYLLLPDATAVIEIAEACGLHLLSDQERNPLITSSYGVGELMVHAIEAGAQRLIIGLGGSATNDAGMGMMRALGMGFLDAKGELLGQGGDQLSRLAHITTHTLHPKISTLPITAACDVTNPLCGAQGASAIFATQKGANPKDVQRLDLALSHLASVSERLGFAECQANAGAGAAGGLGFALMSFCGASLQPGFDIVADVVGLERQIAQSDLVITGEGRLDAQSLMGKVAGGVATLAAANNVPVIAICGSVAMPSSIHGGKGAPYLSSTPTLPSKVSSRPRHHLQSHSHLNPNLNLNPDPLSQSDNDINPAHHTSHPSHPAGSMSKQFDVIMPSIQQVDTLQNTLDRAYANIETTAFNLAAAMRLGQRLS